MTTLAADYPKEQARLRELIEAYREIGPAGAFGLYAIERVLARADTASAGHDTVALIRCLSEMRECQ